MSYANEYSIYNTGNEYMAHGKRDCEEFKEKILELCGVTVFEVNIVWKKDTEIRRDDGTNYTTFLQCRESDKGARPVTIGRA